jgi:uncharacterized tellurite resistance protein B-like protein
MTEKAPEDPYTAEMMKLLMQVAYAEGKTNKAERRVIEEVGRNLKMPERELQNLLKFFDSGQRLPPPDMSVLKARQKETLDAVRALISADGQIANDELTAFEQIQALIKKG